MFPAVHAADDEGFSLNGVDAVLLSNTGEDSVPLSCGEESYRRVFINTLNVLVTNVISFNFR